MTEKKSPSTWKIEVAEGNDLAKSGVPLKNIPCLKNPGHTDFIEFKGIKLGDLPEGHRTESLLRDIINWGNRVVRLVVEKKETGNGFIVEGDKNNFYVQTNDKLVQTEYDVRNCSIQFASVDGNESVICKGDTLRCSTQDMAIFTFHPIPEFLREEIVKCRERKEKLLVRLEVTRYSGGTGYVFKSWNHYVIKTNNHVIKTKADVNNCFIDFNFDSLDRQDVVTCRGKTLIDTCHVRDITGFTFEPVPQFIKDLDIIDYGNLYPRVDIIYINGHIDSSCQCIYSAFSNKPLFYLNQNINNTKIYNIILTFPGGFHSSPVSHYLTFHPIPENIKSFANEMVGFHHPLIQLHRENGTVKTILGKFIYTLRQMVFLLLEPLTIKESKRCVIHFPFGLISRGTGLYFETKDSTSFFSNRYGVDFEYNLNVFPRVVVPIDFKPRPTDLERMEHDSKDHEEDGNMNYCVIGHPHGGIKMVTFGEFLGSCHERFDDTGNTVDPDQEGHDVKCIHYSCPTCPGSSRSPVINLPSLVAFPGGVNLTHFMGVNEQQPLSDGKVVTNKNTAWSPVTRFS